MVSQRTQSVPDRWFEQFRAVLGWQKAIKARERSQARRIRLMLERKARTRTNDSAVSNYFLELSEIQIEDR
eukprot:3934711-Amphidinium_carterae.2